MASKQSISMTTQNPQWFEYGSRVGSKSPDTLENEHRSFREKISRSLSKSKGSGGKLTLATTQEDVERQLASAGCEASILTSAQLKSDAARELVIALEVKGTYEQDREAGKLKAGSAAQRGLAEVAMFAGAYCNLLQVVACAGAPYAEVGFQTLSILLMAFVNKTENDTLLINHFIQIRKSFPRLDIWNQIYPTDLMKELVSQAYWQVIDFARAAAFYLQRFRHRLYLAINPVATAEFHDAASQLYQTLAEINAEAMIGLHDNTRFISQTLLAVQKENKQAAENIERLMAESDKAAEDRAKLIRQAEEAKEHQRRLADLNEGLKAQVEDLNRQARRREREDDMNRLGAFQKLLKVENLASEYDLETTKKTLAAVFPTDEPVSAHVPHTGYLQLDAATLAQTPAYQSWLATGESSLLFLSGSTAYEGRKLRGAAHSWLSPAAVHMAEELTRQQKQVLFFSAQPTLYSETMREVEMVAAIAARLLEWHPELLRHHEGLFRRILQPDGRQDDFSTEAMFALLRAVLERMEHLDTVYFVIDRLDRCTTRLGGIMDRLAGIVSVIQSPTVKIAVVAELSGGCGWWQPGDLPEHEFSLDKIYEPGRWDQRRLTSSEASTGHRQAIWS